MVMDMDNMHFERPKKEKLLGKTGLLCCNCRLPAGRRRLILDCSTAYRRQLSVLGESSSVTLSSPTAVDHKVSDVPYTEPSEPDSSSAPISSAPSSSTASSETASETEASPFFVLPVGGNIMKDFDSDNLQYSETYKDWRLHLGIDIAAEQGTPVLAAADGTVAEVREDALLGTVAVIRPRRRNYCLLLRLEQEPFRQTRG